MSWLAIRAGGGRRLAEQRVRIESEPPHGLVVRNSGACDVLLDLKPPDRAGGRHVEVPARGRWFQQAAPLQRLLDALDRARGQQLLGSGRERETSRRGRGGVAFDFRSVAGRRDAFPVRAGRRHQEHGRSARELAPGDAHRGRPRGGGVRAWGARDPALSGGGRFSRPAPSPVVNALRKTRSTVGQRSASGCTTLPRIGTKPVNDLRAPALSPGRCPRSSNHSFSFGAGPGFAAETSTSLSTGLTLPRMRPSRTWNSARRSSVPRRGSRSAWSARRLRTSRSSSPFTAARPEKVTRSANGSAVRKTETAPVFCRVPLSAARAGSPLASVRRVARFSSAASRS